MEKHFEVYGYMGFFPQIIMKNMESPWGSLRGNSTDELVARWLGLNQLNPKFLPVEVFEREMML